MSITEVGRQGEEMALEYLTKVFEVERIFQADWQIKYAGTWCVVEVKHQEMFTAGRNIPFDGHGLPPRQVESRLLYYRDTGIPCLFLVIEKSKNPPTIIWFQFLHILEKGRWKNTQSDPTLPNARRIYDIQSFEKVVLPFDLSADPSPRERLEQIIHEHLRQQYLDTLAQDDPPF